MSVPVLNKVEMRWLIIKEIPFDRVLQSRMCFRMVSDLRGVEYMHSSWEDIPTVMENEL